MQCGEDGVRRERLDYCTCVQSNLRALSIVRDWEATVLEAEAWVVTATEGGRGSMATRRKEDSARHWQEKREANEIVSYTKA